MESVLLNITKFHYHKFIDYYVLSNILGTFTYILCPTLVFWNFQANEGNDSCLGHC